MTANARLTGTHQSGGLQSHRHHLRTTGGGAGGTTPTIPDELFIASMGNAGPGGGMDPVSTFETGGKETRPINTALFPRLHV